MKFDDIKKAINQQIDGDITLPKSIRCLKSSQLPIERVRKTMLGEIITQLAIVVVFFMVPWIVNMPPEPQAIYLITMFVVCTITVGYVLKMWIFFRRTSATQYNCKDTIQNFIFELKILLEVYKTAVVAGSVLLPVPMAAYILGSAEKTMKYYHQLFTLDYTLVQLVLLVVAYLLLVVIFYITTVKWSERLYGSQILALEGLLDEYREASTSELDSMHDA